MTTMAELSSSDATKRTSVVPWKPPYMLRWVDRAQWVGLYHAPETMPDQFLSFDTSSQLLTISACSIRTRAEVTVV
jgi:hypothetical protein